VSPALQREDETDSVLTSNQLVDAWIEGGRNPANKNTWNTFK
jgi:hypothetical protein